MIELEKRLRIFSRKEFIENLQREDVSQRVCISLADPGSDLIEELDSSYYAYLKAEFYDLHVAPEDNPDIRLVCREDIERIVKFIQCFARTRRGFDIHCNAGIGRSTAIGIIVAHCLGCSHEEIIEGMLRVRRQALPNELVIDYADQVLSENLSSVNAVIRERRIQNMKASLTSFSK